jgi:hypothetical protein
VYSIFGGQHATPARYKGHEIGGNLPFHMPTLGGTRTLEGTPPGGDAFFDIKRG